VLRRSRWHRHRGRRVLHVPEGCPSRCPVDASSAHAGLICHRRPVQKEPHASPRPEGPRQDGFQLCKKLVAAIMVEYDRILGAFLENVATMEATSATEPSP
jgi:hypothetical protein